LWFIKHFKINSVFDLLLLRDFLINDDLTVDPDSSTSGVLLPLF